MKKHICLLAFVVLPFLGNSQVLISLIFGKALNTGKVEFGLDGGLTLSNIQGLDRADQLAGFNLGFYFDIKMKNPSWMLNTGVIVKSPMGARGLPVYSLDNPDLDKLFTDGSVTSRLRYFHVPIMMKYKFKNNFYIKAGTQLGLLNKAYDEFYQSVADDDDLLYTVKNRDNYHRIDAGIALGAGYRLMGWNGMNIGVQYYWGLVDITLDDSGPGAYNRGFYATVGIPIGKQGGKKEQKK